MNEAKTPPQVNSKGINISIYHRNVRDLAKLKLAKNPIFHINTLIFSFFFRFYNYFYYCYYFTSRNINNKRKKN